MHLLGLGFGSSFPPCFPGQVFNHPMYIRKVFLVYCSSLCLAVYFSETTGYYFSLHLHLLKLLQATNEGIIIIFNFQGLTIGGFSYSSLSSVCLCFFVRKRPNILRAGVIHLSWLPEVISEPKQIKVTLVILQKHLICKQLSHLFSILTLACL